MADRESNLRIAMDRGAKANALLSNDLLQEAFAKIEAALLDDWKQTGSEDRQRRDDAWRSYKLLQSLKTSLERIVTNGSAAGKELLQIKEPTLIQKIRR